MSNKLVNHFLERSERTEHSVLSLAGTGPNGSSQLKILYQIGRDKLQSLARINVVSGSVISYFIYIALLEGCFKTEGYKNYDRLVRRLHRGSLLKLLWHCTVKYRKQQAYFDNQLLKDTLNIFLEQRFIQRNLSSFDSNLRFHVYCLSERKLVEISAQSFPKMTVEDIARACISIPLLHGPFQYGSYRFVDPIFTQSFRTLRMRLFSQSQNHLYVNIKKSGQSKNITFVKNEDRLLPVAAMLLDFVFLCGGIPNRHIRKTHENNLRLI